jgi:hypothetical protein
MNVIVKRRKINNDKKKSRIYTQTFTLKEKELKQAQKRR